jgi:hypothetical protein
MGASWGRGVFVLRLLSGFFFSGLLTVFVLVLTSCGGNRSALNPVQTLTVTMAGTGSGTVTSSPAGISCPTTCTASFPQGTQVTLTETPGGNAVFTAWNGACSGTSTCSVTLSATNAVTAMFSGGDSGSPGPFIYVSSTVSDETNQVQAFAADANGQLTPVPGSPFADNIGRMAVNSQYLFGTNGVNIYSYSIASNGAITQVASVNARQYNNPVKCSGGPTILFLDNTGATLYDLDYDSDCANNQYQSFSIDSSSGALTYLGGTAAVSPVFQSKLSFLGNHDYAYGASCYHYFQEIFSFGRNSDGTLILNDTLNANPPLPTAPAGDAYCPWLAAADPTDHLAISLTPINGSTFEAAGPAQLASYTADSSGNLSTTNSASNMPAVATGGINDMEISRAGNYLAVAGTGLQVFQFNGADPLTQLTGLIINDQVNQVLWDKNDHLYAISLTSGKLFVFSVTASGATPAPGSPYAITTPGNMAVLSN